MNGTLFLPQLFAYGAVIHERRQQYRCADMARSSARVPFVVGHHQGFAAAHLRRVLARGIAQVEVRQWDAATLAAEQHAADAHSPRQALASSISPTGRTQVQPRPGRERWWWSHAARR